MGTKFETTFATGQFTLQQVCLNFEARSAFPWVTGCTSGILQQLPLK